MVLLSLSHWTFLIWNLPNKYLLWSCFCCCYAITVVVVVVVVQNLSQPTHLLFILTQPVLLLQDKYGGNQRFQMPRRKSHLTAKKFARKQPHRKLLPPLQDLFCAKLYPYLHSKSSSHKFHSQPAMLSKKRLCLILCLLFHLPVTSDNQYLPPSLRQQY